MGRLAAEEHFQLQEWEALLETLDRVQKLSSRDAGLYAMRGEAEAGLGRLDEAIEAFAKAAKLDKKNAAYRTRRDALQAELEAEQEASAAAAAEPADAAESPAAAK